MRFSSPVDIVILITVFYCLLEGCLATTEVGILTSSVTLQCGREAAKKFTWKHNGEIISNKTAFDQTIKIWENNSLWIATINHQHEGKYTCSNEAGKEKRRYLLKIAEINLQPIELKINGLDANGDILVARNTQITVTCKAAISGFTGYDGLNWIINITGRNIQKQCPFTDSCARLVTHHNSSASTTVASFSILHTPMNERETISCRVRYKTFQKNTQRTLKTSEINLQPIEVKINGLDANGDILVARNTQIKVTCKAAIPRFTDHAGLNLIISITDGNISTQCALNDSCASLMIQNNNSFPTVASFTIPHIPKKERENISCRVRYKTFQTHTQRTIKTFEINLQPIEVKINGLDAIGDILVARNTQIKVTCEAAIRGFTGYNRLNWMISVTNRNVLKQCAFTDSCASLMTHHNSSSSTTVASFSILHTPTKERETISCTVRYKTYQTHTQRTIKTFEPEQKPKASITYIYFLLAVVVILFCCVPALWKINAARRCKNFTRYKASSTESHPTHLAMATRCLPPLQSNNTESVMLEENIPGVSDQCDEKENNYLSVSDVKLDFQLPSNGPMTYWKATVTCSEISVTDVIAKSVSECARMRDLFNFREIAKAIMTLPKHDNIVELIGASLEDVPYFIYQEYIERGTLKDYMLRHCKTTTNDDSLELEVPDQEKNLQLTQFAVDICEGMFFLAQQNFRHPGLSARKVLLTPAGKCKLYDFCPVDVAVDSINQILQKKIPPTAWLAPETIFIGHYVEKSDVWSFGVVLWEIYSQVPHFIYQEHIECGTLKDVLLRNYQHFSDSSKVATAQLAEHEKTLQLTVYAVDVCNGMFFLASQKFLYPGLAARKVLLTSSGKCKLYDFWPVDLAQERMDSILESKFPPLAWLAPETVFLGHYKEKSDVWNFGVVVWEIYSLGDTPFGGLTCPEIEKKLRAKDNLDQPLACPGGLFGVLLSTWNSSIEERPSFGRLRNTFMEFLKNMKQIFNRRLKRLLI
ncbi:uncharacterized protein [Apostichopus japonicus]|uniref:uncharacterized protein isoform X2 n=1 Tax=Stichopus japonicus TaxID=307972 RepID=UPI003AB7E4C0